MRNKKLLSTVVASALVASTMAMPVMAQDGGKVDVDFTTKTPIIRVAVPTTILAAVDPLEMNTPGTQIHSTDFKLTNKSEVPVGIDVKSVVTLGSGVTLVDTKAGAADSANTEVWLGVAAQTSDGNYIETANKTAGDLTEADANVATFKTDATESSASQTFYLNKGTGTAGYKLAAPDAAGVTADTYNEELTYAQVYALADATYADVDALLTALKTSDVYEGTADTDGIALTLIPKGTTKWDGFDKDAKKYFTVSSTTNAVGNMADGTKYVYGEGGDGEETAFRYIGKLGQGKNSWSDTDISKMTITYSIYGLTDEKFTEAETSYGLYTPVTGPQVSLSTSGVISITNFDGTQYGSMSLNDGSQDWPLVTGTDGTWEWGDAVDAKKEFTLASNWMPSYLAGKTAIVTLTLKDGTSIQSAPVTFPAA